MSNSTKTVLWVVGIIVVVGGGWMLLRPSDDMPSVQNVSTDQTSATPNQDETATGASTDTSTGAAMTGPSDASDTSDSSINNDTANIDAQMKGLDSDSSASAPASDNQ